MMSNQSQTIIKIGRRAGYWIFFSSARSLKVLNARELIAGCYEIS